MMNETQHMTVIPTTNIFTIASTHDICSAALQDLSKNAFSRSQDPRPAFSLLLFHIVKYDPHSPTVVPPSGPLPGHCLF